VCQISPKETVRDLA
jgi:hypothetical protein